MSRTATVRAFRLGPVEIEFADGVESRDLKGVLEEMDIRQEGSSVWLNGQRLTGEGAATAKVSPGDKVKVSPKSDQGE